MSVSFTNAGLSAQQQDVQSLKQKPVTAYKQKSATELMAEELVTIHRTLKANGSFDMIDRMDELKKSLQAIANEHYAPDEPVVFKTEAGTVLFSARTNAYKANSPEAVVEALTPQVALQIAKFNVTDLKKYLSPIELGKIGSFDWGSRSMKDVSYTVPITS